MKFLVLAWLAVSVAMFYACGDKDQIGSGVKGEDPSIYSIKIYNHPRKPTPKGVQIYAYNEISDEARNAIDRGLDITFALAEKQYPGKTFKRHKDYIARVFENQPKCGNAPSAFTVGPSMSVGQPNPYDNTEFDLDQRAGWTQLCVVGAYNRKYDGPDETYPWHPSVAVVNGMDIIETAARYEAEHGVLEEIDPQRFGETAIHGQGQGHPILGEPTAVGLRKASPEAKGAMCAGSQTDTD